MTSANQPVPRSRLQFSLLSLLLMATLIGVWVANYRLSDSIARRRSELPALRNYARELIVADPMGFSTVAPHKLWMDDYRWHVYVPSRSAGSILALQTTNIDDPSMDRPEFQASLPPGRHELQLKYEQVGEAWRIQVLINGDAVIDESLPSEWNSARGSRGGSSIAQLEHFQTTPIKLFDRRFVNWNRKGGTTPLETSNGIRLWIAKE